MSHDAPSTGTRRSTSITTPRRRSRRRSSTRCARTCEEQFGNPSSAHRVRRRRASGGRARRGSGRERCSAASPTSVVFTASGSEADNLAIKGVALAASRRRRSHRHLGDRASGGPRCVPLPRAAPGLSADHRACRRLRSGRPGRMFAARSSPDAAGQRHARQQRGRHAPADRRDRRRRARASDRPVIPTRRSRSARSAVDVDELGVRPADRDRPQALCPQGHRRAVRAARHAARLR